jgi:glycosyltransferase involved in cell wall biosynthesis
MMGFISIVTINLNNLEGLKKTFQSVFSQDYTNFEYLIIDGDSKDGSVDLIRLNNKKINYWISEEDKGIYDAMNKAITQAKGDYILFLNSGDYFSGIDSLSKLVGAKIDADIVYGNIGMYKDTILEIKKYPAKLTVHYFHYDTLPHQATLIKRNLFKKFGYYNTQYRIVSDWIFFWDVIIKGKASYKYVDQLISIFDLNGISSRPESYKIIRDEMDLHFINNYYYHYLIKRLKWASRYYPIRILQKLKLVSEE